MNSAISSNAGRSLRLSELPLQTRAIVFAVSTPQDGQDEATLRRMAEIGFLPGEPIHVVARVPGGDPMAVRIGNSTFALRRREAELVHVTVGATP